MADEVRKVTKLAAIKEFFEKDGGKKVEMSELVQFKKTDPQGVEDLGKMAAEAIGAELAS